MMQPLLKLLNKYHSVSWLEDEILTHYLGDPLGIDLKDSGVIINKSPCSISHARQSQLNDELHKLQKLGVIPRLNLF